MTTEVNETSEHIDELLQRIKWLAQEIKERADSLPGAVALKKSERAIFSLRMKMSELFVESFGEEGR